MESNKISAASSNEQVYNVKKCSCNKNNYKQNLREKYYREKSAFLVTGTMTQRIAMVKMQHM